MNKTTLKDSLMGDELHIHARVQEYRRCRVTKACQMFGLSAKTFEQTLGKRMEGVFPATL